MNSWLTKLRISAALDSRRALPDSLQTRIDRSEELRRFGQDLRALDQALRHAPAPPEVDAVFHSSIMRKVRAAKAAAAPQRKTNVLRWLPAPAFASLAVLFIWAASRQLPPTPARTPVPDTRSLAAASNALEVGNLMARTAPSAALGPLSEEWDRVSRDLDNTAQFLLASLP